MNDSAPASPSPRTPYSRQIALQSASVFAVLAVAWPYYGFRHQPLPWPETSLLIGALALTLACLTRQLWWWRIIHALFAPAACAALSLDITPGWYLAAAVLLFLVYRGALSGQVPLYFSGRRAARALIELCAASPPARFIDLGGGIGSVVCPLARALGNSEIVGVENAHIPWLIGRLRTRRLANCRWLMGDLWQTPLGDADVVYAFLSPAPMAELWLKVKREMRPGSLFISNSFAVPGVEASFVIELGATDGARLYGYRL